MAQEKLKEINNIIPTIINDCEACNYDIIYLDEDKWTEVCGNCGRTKDVKIEIQEIYDNLQIKIKRSAKR
jgi:hypothetical protein